MSVNILAFRAKLANIIATSEDLELLKKVGAVLGLNKDTSKVYSLSEEEAIMVEESLEQIYNGEYTSAEIADKEIEEWLNK